MLSAPSRSLINFNSKLNIRNLNFRGKKNVLFKSHSKNIYKIQFMNQSQINKEIEDVSKTKPFKRKDYYQDDYHLLTTVYSETGSMSDIPKWYPLGILKIVANIVFFIFVGSLISKKCVSLLEEYDIFKPEDDEDDEDDD